ncbi:type 2 lantibiotic biosynthesis protein LanM [Amycolatopsis bartoniae]|uniref:Lantibiotic biosynthesis protein dehydration domain-containing protein n=1 Tax=Amycolatopsis bartoniae TaxID=941986 RepID=A0A8H9IRG7_9PSEU|nr:type 2 lanthipeptide synthetase LanM family protein [Amycolatopsis bartoniae]MBB2937996.1 type 2 lantibiotic biosynthesis protein LanM [Amycolatopsis bartoniae]GHF42197.1 hypothetical protein GCM10017566_14730 [Amycolatopsis bartoniae]
MSQTATSAPRAEKDAGSWWAAALYPGEHAGAEPVWARLVDQVLSGLPEQGATPPPADAGDERVFVPVLRPFLAHTARLVEGELDERTRAAVDLPAVWADAERWLAGRLAAVAARTFVRELHAVRAAGLLRGQSGRDRFADFLRRLGGRAALAGVFTRYPVLARLLAETCLRTAAAVTELLRRLAADRATLETGLLRGNPGPLTGLELGSGDLHAGGRAVAVLTFADGTRLVYKPRPLGLLARWNELLGWFAGHRPELAPRPLGVLPRAGYGWAEFVPVRGCEDRAGVELFYRRLGSLLALLYALDATDMHCENLIACGDQPVLVDVETLFHPAFATPPGNGPDPALAALHRSVARTALLPTLVLGEHGALDVSAVGGDSGAQYPEELPRWSGAGTDDMRLVRGRLSYAGGTNRPLLDGDGVDAGRYRQSLLTGFRTAYDCLAAHQDELTAFLGAFAAEEIRLVMRPTQVYAQLLTGATHPDHLVDGPARESAFAALAADPRPHLGPLRTDELAELRAGDVPLFTARAGATDVTTASGVLPGLLTASGLDRARAKAGSLCAEDRHEQEWLISATLATRQGSGGHGDAPALPGPVAAALPDSGHLLAIAAGIGDEMVARALHDDTRANWLGLELVEGRHWLVLPMGAGLAEGHSGTALFLAQLGRLTGVARYCELAAKSVRALPALVEVLAEHPDLARQVGPGGFFGLGGICYALARLARLLDDPVLAASLPAAVAATAAAATGAPANVGEGVAGALAALHAVHAETGLPEAAELAATLARQLAALPRPGEPGFLWGAAGVDWALGRSGSMPSAPGLGWCSGAAGTVLAAPGATAADEFAQAVAARPPLLDHSLCHGELGTIEALVVSAGQGHEPSVSALRKATARLTGAIEQYGPQCGTPHGVPSPGLLTGTGGIGFGLLRAGFPGEVPSVLLLGAEEH